MHGFLTRDDIAPSEFRAVALQELERYKNVELWNGEVTDVARDPNNLFRVVLDAGRSELARKLLIATGVRDQLPPLPRIEEFWGKASTSARIAMDGKSAARPSPCTASGSAAWKCARNDGLDLRCLAV